MFPNVRITLVAAGGCLHCLATFTGWSSSSFHEVRFPDGYGCVKFNLWKVPSEEEYMTVIHAFEARWRHGVERVPTMDSRSTTKGARDTGALGERTQNGSEENKRRAPSESRQANPAKRPKTSDMSSDSHKGQTKIDEATKSQGNTEENVSSEARNGAQRQDMKQEAKGKEMKAAKADESPRTPKTGGENVKSTDSVEVRPELKEKDEASSVLEKGIIYFFFRPKVTVEHPESLSDVQRSYIILRPLPGGASLKEGPLQDGGNNRLLAIPKKKFPETGRHERLLTFVEKAHVSLKDLRETVLSSSTYQTKTRGERTTPAARPVGEGVYALMKNSRDRQSHLAYVLTVPDKPDELQRGFGLRERGSFVISVRNPETPAPRNVAIKTPAKFPKEMMDEFNGLRWMAALPKHFDYVNAEILLIGERDEIREKESEDRAAVEQLERLEEEDEKRVKHVDGSHAIFRDLEVNSKGYVGVKGTWEDS